MFRKHRINYLFAFLWFVAFTIYGTRRTALGSLLLMPAFLCYFFALVMSFVDIFTNFREERWLSPLPFLTCVGCFFLPGPVVRVTRHLLFVSELPKYQAVIRQFESGQLVAATEWGRNVGAEKKLPFVDRVYAMKESDNSLVVTFLTEGGIPPRHAGYLYSSSGTIDSGSFAARFFEFRHELQPFWFAVSD